MVYSGLSTPTSSLSFLSFVLETLYRGSFVYRFFVRLRVPDGDDSDPEKPLLMAIED